MLILVCGTVALNVKLIEQVVFDGDVIKIKLRDGTEWSLRRRSKRYFNSLVKKINEAQSEIAEKGSNTPQNYE